MNKEIYQQLANALEALATKYNIPVNEMQPIAKMCGTAIAQQHMDEIERRQGQEAVSAVDPSQPMDTGADELVGALGGR